jgi:hypothetical protein
MFAGVGTRRTAKSNAEQVGGGKPALRNTLAEIGIDRLHPIQIS